MARDPLYKEVVEVKDGRRGVVVEIARSPDVTSLAGTVPGVVVGVRLWLDGEPQPEQTMRPPSDLVWA